MNLNKYHFFWKVSLSCIFGNHTFWLGCDFRVSSSLSSVGDPDLQIRGRGGLRSSRPWDKGGGVSKKLGKKFWSKNKVGGGPPLDPPLLFQSESRPCETIAMKMIISILVQIKWNSFSLGRFCTKPCFESEFLDFVNGLLSTCYMTAHADTKVFICFISKGN